MIKHKNIYNVKLMFLNSDFKAECIIICKNKQIYNFVI